MHFYKQNKFENRCFKFLMISCSVAWLPLHGIFWRFDLFVLPDGVGIGLLGSCWVMILVLEWLAGKLECPEFGIGIGLLGGCSDLILVLVSV